MKKILTVICAAVLTVFCASMLILSLTFSPGDIKEVRVNIEPSTIYSEADIDDAVYAALCYFKREFGGCSLLELSYDEALSEKAAAEWAEQYDADEAIVLTSSFKVTGKSDGSLAEGETYRNWQWILVRNNGKDWRVKTCGY